MAKMGPQLEAGNLCVCVRVFLRVFMFVFVRFIIMQIRPRLLPVPLTEPLPLLTWFRALEANERPCVWVCIKSCPRAAWTRPRHTQPHRPSPYANYISFWNFATFLPCQRKAAHTLSIHTLTYTLWAFNALAKLKLTANVTFYDCVCISTVSLHWKNKLFKGR